MDHSCTVVDNMIIIPSGSFSRGSLEFPDEGPVAQVFLDSFAIDRTPVTNHEFRKFMEAGGYEERSFWTVKGWAYIRSLSITTPNYWADPLWNQDEHPVTGVSWWEAMAYATFVSKTLPTEAQWEYACKGCDDRKYPWGNEEPTLEHANFAINCDPAELRRSSTAVDAYPQNRSYFGCLDMAGNLAEWCLDNAAPNYEYDHTRQNPVYIEDEANYHIVRGGCGLHNESYLRCTSRDSYPATLRDNLVGFRCATSIR